VSLSAHSDQLRKRPSQVDIVKAIFESGDGVVRPVTISFGTNHLQRDGGFCGNFVACEKAH
jgi:hypothetical protein